LIDGRPIITESDVDRIYVEGLAGPETLVFLEELQDSGYRVPGTSTGVAITTIIEAVRGRHMTKLAAIKAAMPSQQQASMSLRSVGVPRRNKAAKNKTTSNSGTAVAGVTEKPSNTGPPSARKQSPSKGSSPNKRGFAIGRTGSKKGTNKKKRSKGEGKDDGEQSMNTLLDGNNNQSTVASGDAGADRGTGWSAVDETQELRGRASLVQLLGSDECRLFTRAVPVKRDDIDRLIHAGQGSARTLIHLQALNLPTSGREFETFEQLIEAVNDKRLASLEQIRGVKEYINRPRCKLFRQTKPLVVCTDDDAAHIFFDGMAGEHTLLYLRPMEKQGVAFKSVDELIRALVATHRAAHNVATPLGSLGGGEHHRASAARLAAIQLDGDGKRSAESMEAGPAREAARILEYLVSSQCLLFSEVPQVTLTEQGLNQLFAPCNGDANVLLHCLRHFDFNCRRFL
jgi:hypothetical protein